MVWLETHRIASESKSNRYARDPSSLEAKRKLTSSASQKKDLKSSALPPIPSANMALLGDESISIEAVGSKTGKERSSAAPAAEISVTAPPVENVMEQKLLKPLPHFENSELRELASIITRDIFTMNPDVTWDSIAGLEKSKRLIKEAIVFPIKFPQYNVVFTLDYFRGS
jgi:SpoVK/Ycf46/Vps4 family AAA+-type ATPase